MNAAVQGVDAARVLVLFGSVSLYGQERANLQVFRSLRSAGVTPLFLTHRQHAHWNIHPALEEAGFPWVPADYSGLMRRSIHPRVWTANLWSAARGNLDLQRAIRRFRPTHIHVANPLYFLSMMPTLSGCRLPIVYRAGDAPPLHNRFWRAAWRHIRSRVTRFVANSRYTRNSLIDSGVDPTKVELIYTYPPQTGGSQPLGADVRIAQADVRMIYLGQIAPHKGVVTLVEAAIAVCRQHAGAGLTLVGDDVTNPALVDQLKRQIEAAGMAERIVFAGYIRNSAALLGEHHIHVCPSQWQDPLPNTILEAKASGLPTVATPMGGIPEIVEDGVDGHLVPAGDASQLAAALGRLVADAPHRRQLGEAARASLVTLGAVPEIFAARWLEVFRRTAGQADSLFALRHRR